MSSGDAGANTSTLAARLASAVRQLIGGVRPHEQLVVPPSADVAYVLERFIPALLRERYPEWDRESLDGIFVARATKSDAVSVSLVGTCILISDQRSTPFAIELRLAAEHDGLTRTRIMLGERGGGPLGISGPACDWADARRLLAEIAGRAWAVDWSYTYDSELE